MFFVDWPWDDLYKGQRNDCCCKNVNIKLNVDQKQVFTILNNFSVIRVRSYLSYMTFKFIWVLKKLLKSAVNY